MCRQKRVLENWTCLKNFGPKPPRDPRADNIHAVIICVVEYTAMGQMLKKQFSGPLFVCSIAQSKTHEKLN
jgi:hypothetical protein